MDIKILDSWLREILNTTARPKDIARCLSLCGPSIEKVEEVKLGNKVDYIYHIEVTTNRVDCMSVMGIAREAVTILPQFGFKASLIPPKTDNGRDYTDKEHITIVANPKLENRMIGVILEINSLGTPPQNVKERLEASDIRSLNTVVDITNYVMTEVGHPCHVFDFDLIKPIIRVRESRKGESVQSFDGTTHILPGEDIVFENDSHEITDLPGIIGTKNSVVNANTKRVLFFIDNNEPVHLRKTSMKLGIRTVAAVLNEKGVDPQLAEIALKRGLYLFKNLLGAKQISKIYDVYSNHPKQKRLKVSHAFIEKYLGIKIKSTEVSKILNSLGFVNKYLRNDYIVDVPSYRLRDVSIPEDIVEEVARIHGYHNLPSMLMPGLLPEKPTNSPFVFENNLKNILMNLGGHEAYNFSLVPMSNVSKNALKLKNPLAKENEYLRQSLMPGLISCGIENSKNFKSFHIFELGSVYLPNSKSLPTEDILLAGIIFGMDYREASGIIEAFLAKLNITFAKKVVEKVGFNPSSCIEIEKGSDVLGFYGVTQEKDIVYYEFSIKLLSQYSTSYPLFKPLPKYPPQVENLTFVLPERTVVSEFIETAISIDKQIKTFELLDIYNNSYTFLTEYQNPEKTLTDKEVETLRNELIKKLSSRFHAVLK